MKAKTIRNTHVVLRKALNDAERLGLVPRNAAAAAKPPVVGPVEHQIWDSDQLVQFFESVAENRLHAAYVLAATTGMRRGEVLGLRRAALLQLGSQLPAPVIADALGITATTATDWVKAAGGDWANYAAATARNQFAQPRQEPHQMQHP